MNKKIRISLLTVLFLAPVFAPAQSAQDISVPKLARSLSLGMQGDDIKSLQEFLSRDPQIYPEGLATGYFGLKTQAAVKRWQQKYGIEAIGIVGPKTIAKIKEAAQSSIKETSTPTASAPETVTAAASSPSVASIAPEDTIPPTATLAPGVPAPTSIYIKFTPSEEVTAIYEYGLTANYGSVKEVSNQYSSSTAGISLENLVSSTTYRVRVKATDKAGNVGYSQNYTFTTPSLSDAPIISYGPNVKPSNSSPPPAVNISWGTNIDCTGIVYYGADSSFGNAKYSDKTTTDHSLVIEGLSSGASYMYKVHCDTADKAVKSGNFIFIATSTSDTSSAIPGPFLANILKTFEKIIQKFKFNE